MQGLPEPHPATLVSTMVRSSAIVGKRQSQWLTNPPVCELPSLTQFPTPVAPPFSVLRKLVKAVPSGMPPLSQAESAGLASTHHVYPSFTQCRHPLPATFFSHWSPVCLSVTVPSPLSMKRRVVVVVLLLVDVVVELLVVVVLLVDVDVLVVVGVWQSPAVQSPLQHWPFPVQV